MSLDTLRRANTLDKLLSQVQAESAPQEKKSYVDERLWKPELDKSGNGYAVIRFLPAPEGEELPWVKLWKHAFQGPTGKWYIENSLTTLNGGQKTLYQITTLNSGTLVLNQTKRLQGNRNVNLSTTQISTLSLIPNTQRMKERYSFLGMVRKSLIR